MKRMFWAGALSIATAAATATSAMALENKIGSVDVQFDVDAVKSKAAAEFWGDLETDLETAIIKRIVPDLDDEGLKIDIDVDELAISESLEAVLGEKSVLKGEVFIHDAESEKEEDAKPDYILITSVQQAGRIEYGEDFATILTQPPEVIYTLMVDAFADNVVDRLK